MDSKKHKYEYQEGVDVRFAKCNTAYDRGEVERTITYKSGPITQFSMSHDPVIEGVKKVKINKIRIPRTYYEIGGTNENNFAFSVGGSTYNATIPNGTYTPLQFAHVLTRAIRHTAGGAGMFVFWENAPLALGAGSETNKSWVYPGRFVIWSTVGAFSVDWPDTDNVIRRMMGAPFTVNAGGNGVSYLSGQNSSVDSSGYNTVVCTNPANPVRWPVLYIGSNALSSLFSKDGRITKEEIINGGYWNNQRVTTRSLPIIASVHTDVSRRDPAIWFSDYQVGGLPTTEFYSYYNGYHGTGYIVKEFDQDDGYFFSPIPVTLKDVDFSLMTKEANWADSNIGIS